MIIDLGIEKLNKILAEQKMAIIELEIKLKKVVIEKSDLSVDFQHLWYSRSNRATRSLTNCKQIIFH